MLPNKPDFNITDDETVPIPESLRLLNGLVSNESELFIE